MMESEMPSSLDNLSFTVWPPAIDISNPANQQVFNPQFGVANISTTEPALLTRALLLVPVTTPNGTNLAQNAAMVPNAITPGWAFASVAAPPDYEGYVAFELIPDDGEGRIAPGGSVAVTLTGVDVNTAVGTAVLQLQAKTSAGLWTPSCQISLTAPGTTPTITRYTITAADPRTLKTLLGQSVVLNWTTTGAAYCIIEDDQGNQWPNLPTSGSVADTPLQGNSPIQLTPKLGRYYGRTYTLYAFSAGATVSDERPAAENIRLPTIFSMTMSATSIDPTQPLMLAWSIANIDATAGTIALATQPQNGSPATSLTFKPGTTDALVPPPAVSTNYALTIDNGYGIAEQETLPVPDLPSGWTEVTALETLPAIDLDNLSGAQVLAAFGGKLWCGQPTYAGVGLPTLQWTIDATSWTPVAIAGLQAGNGRPSLDGLVVANLGGEGERLWAFGNSPDDNTPYVAKSADGIKWQMQPRPPYPRRWQGAYVATPQGLLVMGGIMYGGAEMQGVWASKDGAAWTKVGTGFPSPSGTTPVVAPFAGKLYAFFTLNGPGVYVSADNGATWTRQGQMFPRMDEYAIGLVPLPDKRLYLFGSLGDVLAMDASGTWSEPFQLPNPTIILGFQTSVIAYADHIWAVNTPPNNANPQFFRLEQPIAGTVVATQTWQTPS
jgi:hypothetical protein